MCHTRLNGGTVERHASVQARTHAAAVRHRPRDLVSTLFMARFQRTAFVSQRAWRPPERECPRNCDQQGLCKSGNSPWSRNRAESRIVFDKIRPGKDGQDVACASAIESTGTSLSCSPWQERHHGKHFRLVRHQVMDRQLHDHLG